MSSIRSEILGVAEMAQALGCADETVELKLRQRELPGVQYGRGWITTREALLAKITEDAQANCAKKASNVVALPTPKKPRRNTPPRLA